MWNENIVCIKTNKQRIKLSWNEQNENGKNRMWENTHKFLTALETENI